MMKHSMVVLIGILMIMVLVIPAMSEDKSPDPGGDPLYQGDSAEESIALRIPADTQPVLSGSGGSKSTPPQSPVLEGGAYANRDTIFVHGTSAVGYLPDGDVLSVYDTGSGHETNLLSHGYTVINCPMPGYYDKTGGVQPKVRYIALHYASDSDGSQWPKVENIHVFNGHELLVSFDTSFSNNGVFSDQVINLGEYYRFDRGMNIQLVIGNGAATTKTFTIGGYGARYEW